MFEVPLHFSPRARVDVFQDSTTVEAEGTLDICEVYYPIKDVDTKYTWFSLFKHRPVNAGMPSNTDLHTIGIEPIIDDCSARHIYHVSLY